MTTKTLSMGDLPILADPTGLSEAVMRVMDACKEWKTVQEQEATKRAVIVGQRDVLLEKIRADRDVMVGFLKGRFETQGAALDGLFKGLDSALASGDPNLVGPILNSIVETVKSSPLGDLVTLDQRMKDNSFTFVLGAG